MSSIMAAGRHLTVGPGALCTEQGITKAWLILVNLYRAADREFAVHSIDLPPPTS